VLSKARTRFGKRVFEDFFNRVLYLCIDAGLVKGEKLFVDGSLIQANASVKSLIPREDALSVSVSPREYVEKVFEENPVEAEDTDNGVSGEDSVVSTRIEGASLF